MNLKLFVTVFTKLKTFPSSHDFQFLVLDIIVGCVVQFVNYLLIARQILNSHHLTHIKFLAIMNYHYGIA